MTEQWLPLLRLYKGRLTKAGNGGLTKSKTLLQGVLTELEGIQRNIFHEMTEKIEEKGRKRARLAMEHETLSNTLKCAPLYFLKNENLALAIVSTSVNHRAYHYIVDIIKNKILTIT